MKTITQAQTARAWAAQMRYDVVRMISHVNIGHPGGSLSCVDILACLYFGGVMNVRPREPRWPERDRCILAKGHAAPAWYSALGRRGFFSPDEFRRLRQFESVLEGHPDCYFTPGVDMTTGPLGQGLSAACGMALAGRLDGRDYYCYVINSDGEMNEGQVWESAQFGAHYHLDHVIAFLDYNKLQLDGPCEEILNPLDLAAKWRAFGWHVQEIDGHDHAAILSAIEIAKATPGRPHYVIAHTLKGKGVRIMENQCSWHSLVNCQAMIDALPALGEEVTAHADVLDAPDVW